MDICLAVPNGLAAIMATYGDPKYRAGGAVDPTWESANMVLARDLSCGVAKLYVHKLIEAPLRAALAACEALGDGYQLRTIACFAPRAQRGSNGLLLSTHTWGIAVDLNADTNPLIAPCYEDDPRRTAPGARDIPDAWIAAFKAQGFAWGGDFLHRFDAMHFQLATGY